MGLFKHTEQPMKTTFRVSRSYPKILRNRKRRIEQRLAPRAWEDQPEPMMRGSNIHYELSDKTRATIYGGLGAVHMMVQRLGLVEAINQDLQLLKIHLPYHESDHVLNIAYNVLSGGQRLEDIELRRQDESFPMAWAPSAFRTRPPQAISPGVLVSKTSQLCRNASIGRRIEY